MRFFSQLKSLLPSPLIDESQVGDSIHATHRPESSVCGAGNVVCLAGQLVETGGDYLRDSGADALRYCEGFDKAG